MELDKIRVALASLGYDVSQGRVNYLTIARKASAEYPMLIELKDFFCRVYFEERRFRVAEFTSQIPDDKYFDSESEVIAYVKEKFPLQ